MDLTNGVRLAGYEILERIGRGGMGDVYRARQESLNRIVALKVLPPELSRNKEFNERFESEARVISMLQHHNIVAIYDFGEAEQNRYFVMQFVEGESLDRKILREKRLKAHEAIQIARQILRALKYAHEHRIIHRDIKPHNVLLDRNGKVAVSDFGIARIFANTRITNTGMTVGTPEYMSPEQSEGVSLDARTDLYSLGIVLYEMLTGIPPFTAENPLAIAYKQVNEQPRAPIDLNEEIPIRLNLIVLKALKKDREQRYKSASEMLADLDSVAADQKHNNMKVVVAEAARRVQEKRITDRRMGDRRRVERRGLRLSTLPLYGWAALIIVAGAALGLAYLLFFPPSSEQPLTGRVSATTTAASQGGERWDVSRIADGEIATAWAGQGTLAGEKDFVLFTFRRPMLVTRLTFYNGLQAGASIDTRYNRARTVDVAFGDGTHQQWALRDGIEPQMCVLPLRPTRLVRVTILDVYPGTEREITPLREVHLWGMAAQ